MPLRATRAVTDLVRFALLDAVALAVVALYLAGLRLWRGDGRALLDPAVVGSIAILTLFALAGAVLIALARGAGLAALLSVASGLVLMLGGTIVLAVIVPKAFEAAGPGAMAMLFPLLASVGAVPAGLVLRALLALF